MHSALISQQFLAGVYFRISSGVSKLRSDSKFAGINFVTVRLITTSNKLSRLCGTRSVHYRMGPVRFGYGSCMGWFERFRFSVPTVPSSLERVSFRDSGTTTTYSK